MRHYVAKLLPAVLVGGCSLIYNPSNLDKPPIDATDAPLEPDAFEQTDAAIDAPPLADANPAALTIDKLAPTTIFEGQGKDGAREALLVIRGHHITPNATVTITPADDITQGTPVVAANGDFIFVPLTIAINTARTDSVDLSVSVSENGATTQTISDQLKLQYLPELTTGTAINVATTPLQPLYSQVALNNVTFTGTSDTPVIIRSVSKISLGNVSVAGANASGGNAGAGGPGGCAGGAAGANAACPKADGGGIGGASGSGGGGGGYGADGAQAPGGADGGAMHGDAYILKYGTGGADANRGAGAGGGGSSAVGGAGGGGGGGGTLELTAGGNIVTGSINANGGNGANGGGLSSAGGGGGGSGGVVVIRSVAGTITTGAVTATGGSPGTGAAGGTSGGAGGVGRIRIDSPVVGAIPTTMPAAHRGVSFAQATPTVVTDNTPTIKLLGTAGDTVDGWVIDHDGNYRAGEPIDQVFPNATLDVDAVLIGGYNTLCFTAIVDRSGLPVIDPLTDSCINIVYLP